MTPSTIPPPVWRKSTRSGENGGNCVEVAALGGGVGVRDSKDQAGPVLRFGPTAWSAFLDALPAHHR
ncbi:DUF397 domain-containing protein [Micromonospora sp. NBC_01813]|uniref:DUF397 domain-containing protein n=1 Tax=Micromonospora sp. NBC_01813 TaxID=2975988 RepID=UPI002DD887A9|nr:DUF397 domain-containing protein [Micromonospora sp. NBC_01813]WSA09289.1 DUF397 domain-containing protein [Micromonospora sp. NBC_01813]